MVDPLRDNLGYFFAERAREAGARTAIVDLWGGTERSLSYRALDERTERAAALLQALGMAPGERFALLVGNRSEFLELFFGAMRAGIVPVPLNTRQSAAVLEFMVADAGCAGVAFDADAAPQAVPALRRLAPRVRIALGPAPLAGWTDYADGIAGASARARPAISPDGIAFQPYTAGSTGRPKGVRLKHDGMLWSIRTTQERWPMPPTEVGLVAVPLFHKNAMRGTIKPVLAAGAKAVIMPRFEPVAFARALAEYGVTFCGGVPAIFSLVLQHEDRLRSLDLSALREISIGSALVPLELMRQLERLLPHAKVKESYGLTEGGGPLRAPLDGRKVPPGSCGVAGPGYEVKLVSEDGTHHAAEGEMWTRNPCVTDGYHNRPDLTRERIVDGWLRTGDVFRVDADGFYYFKGRVDDMFSCGGENIYPREVEELLLSHPAVADACVAAVPHPIKGLAPAALVVLRPGAAADERELKEHALRRGPAYAHPRRIKIVDQIPLSGAGKVDRAAARSMLEALPLDAGAA